MSLKDKIPGYNTLVLPYHFLQSYLAAARFGFPGRRLRVIGVTGTNGKTTTCFMLWKMLNESGHKTGLMTTVAWGVDTLEKQVEHMTTVKPSVLNRRIKSIADSGAEFLVLEVTSHALAQFRTLGIPVEIAVMTNVTHEHLDYHKTFDRYVAAKCRLFEQARYGIINADDPSAVKFKHALKVGHASSALRTTPSIGKNYTSYGIKSGDFRAKSLKLSSKGVKYTCHDINSDKTFPIVTRIPGEFNVYNSLAAVCVGQKLGLKTSEIQKGLAALEEVEGRMNRLDFGQNFEVIVDFAHTPDAFEKVFTSVTTPKTSAKDSAKTTKSSASTKSRRVISLFGGAGHRDESTREERGKIAGKYSDLCILTEDDSRDEDPEEIIDMFEDGCRKAGLKDDQIIRIVDRKTAIERAIELARPGDLVLILGKGHEKTILRADGPHPFEDLKITAAAIKSRLNK